MSDEQTDLLERCLGLSGTYWARPPEIKPTKNQLLKTRVLAQKARWPGKRAGPTGCHSAQDSAVLSKTPEANFPAREPGDRP